MGDFINAFIGLWLVPKYVPAAELGAVLPLTALGGMLGLPISILTIPFMKFLNTYMTRGQYGKVKSLLTDMFVLVIVVFGVVSLASTYLLPFIFERVRVENGSLGVLVILSGTLLAVSPVFAAALQAAKQFNVLAFLGGGGAFVRLTVLLFVLPIRGISGYFVGQIVAVASGVFVSILILWRSFFRGVRKDAYWRNDSGKIMRYAAWAAIVTATGSLVIFGENFVIRHRLSDFESAGYYMISRFAEIAFYLGTTIATILFPLISEIRERSLEGHMDAGRRLVLKSTVVALIGGGVFILVLFLLGDRLFGMIPDWRPYRVFKNLMLGLTMIHVLRGAIFCCMNYCLAGSDFTFVLPFGVINVLEFAFLYCITGYEFFIPWLPRAIVEYIRVVSPCRLDFIVASMATFTIIWFVYSLTHVVFSGRKRGARNGRNAWFVV